MDEKTKVTHLPQTCNEGLASIVGEGKTRKITYKIADHSEKYSDSEQQVRAESWAELVYR